MAAHVTLKQLQNKAQQNADNSNKTFYVICAMGVYYITQYIGGYQLISTHNPKRH